MRSAREFTLNAWCRRPSQLSLRVRIQAGDFGDATVPVGLESELLKIPEDNPLTPEKVALGWQLFYDPRL